MAAPKEQTFTRTSFKAQAAVVTGILRTNPILNDDEKASLNETIGVLTWMNQLQIHWAKEGKGIPKGIPEDVQKQVFEGRTAVALSAQPV